MILFNIFDRDTVVLFHHFTSRKEFAGVKISKMGDVIVFDNFFIPFFTPKIQKLLK